MRTVFSSLDTCRYAFVVVHFVPVEYIPRTVWLGFQLCLCVRNTEPVVLVYNTSGVILVTAGCFVFPPERTLLSPLSTCTLIEGYVTRRGLPWDQLSLWPSSLLDSCV